jgi:hypothetical protein
MKNLILSILISAAATAVAGTYPLTTCVVSGEKLGEMGAPYVFQSGDTEIQLCCDRCKAKFDKDPAKYLAKLPTAQKPGN